MMNYQGIRLKQEFDCHYNHNQGYGRDSKNRNSGSMNSGSETSSSYSGSSDQQQQQQQQQEQEDQINILSYQSEYLGFTTHSALTTYGVCVIDNFLKGKLAWQLLTLVKSLSSSNGLLHDPMMSLSNAKSQSFSRYRDDYITWLSGNENAYHCIETLKCCLNKIIKLFYRYSLSQNQKYCITRRSSVQVSCFPPNSIGYKLHSDNPNDNGRLLTLVYHCNVGYKRDTHGGCSRFFTNNSKYVDIEPKFNRLVIYWSSNYLKVQPCKSSLYSLTTWYDGIKIKQKENYGAPPSIPPLMLQSNPGTQIYNGFSFSDKDL